ncbi:MAG: hypothetical protein R3284_06600 [Rubricoccaceae bacterium]|nr:hypothetical protein [Rubricoccaceae bacterium]
MRYVLLVLVVWMGSGCRSNVVAPPDIVEPDEPVSFSAQVFPILAQSCALAGCHGGTGTNGVRLGSYTEAISSVGKQYGEPIIQPFNADESPIIDKISGVPEYGERMPFGGPYLSTDEIGLIRAWINQGARDN